MLIWTYFTPCSGVSIVNFEQVIAGWVVPRDYPSMDWFLYDNGLRHERVKNSFNLWRWVHIDYLASFRTREYLPFTNWSYVVLFQNNFVLPNPLFLQSIYVVYFNHVIKLLKELINKTNNF